MYPQILYVYLMDSVVFSLGAVVFSGNKIDGLFLLGTEQFQV